MKYLLIAIFCFSAHAGNYIDAEKKVKDLPCKMGGTVDECLTNKATAMVVEDLGWVTSPQISGVTNVQRILLLNGSTQLRYEWQVDAAGNVRAINGKAIGISE